MELTVLILTLLAGLYMAWNIGANDVANAMGTSVGSKALTMKQAVLVAAVLEFSGALLVGSHVSTTLKGKIFFPGAFGGNIEILTIGMLASLVAAGLWLQFATYFGWPVSTTHSIVGAIVGFTLVAGGVSAVNWSELAKIVASWVVSPVLGGTLSFLVFSFIRGNIINSRNPIESVRKKAPFLIFLVFFVLSLVTLWKGLKNLKLDLSFPMAIFMACLLSLLAAVLGSLLIGRLSIKTAARQAQETYAGPGIHMDEQFAFVERIFGYLQVLSACSVAFAHGANDVANSVGPVSAVLSLVHSKVLDPTAPVSAGVLALGGVGIVIGLSTWGYRVIATIGEKITELTPSRGFSAEFGASCTIVLASRLGLPVSTTHTLVGCVLGVGLARGVASINTRVFRDIVISWIVTIPAGGLLAALLFVLLKSLLGL